MRTVIVLSAFVWLILILIIAVPGDYGRYSETIFSLLEFLTLWSIIAIQIWIVVTAAVLLPIAIRTADRKSASFAKRCFRAGFRCATASLVGYVASSVGMEFASRSGMFGMTAGGLLVIFVFFPSIILLLTVAISTIAGFGALAERG